MVCVRSLEEMRKYWGENRDSLLKEYSDGYLVISYMPTRHEHFKTRREVYEKYPTLREQAEGKFRSGTLPRIYDVRQEIDSERDKK